MKPSVETKENSKGVAVITGASSGIGAVYADRVAKRGYDLILVARNEVRLKSLSARLTSESGRSTRVLRADLCNQTELPPSWDMFTNAGLAWLGFTRSIGYVSRTGRAAPQGRVKLDLSASANIPLARQPASLVTGAPAC
jgi:hypothetical protein